MDVSRRQFFKICAGGMAGTTVAALGFAPKQALAQARNYKLLRAKEIRNTCTYCSVGCGLLMYSRVMAQKTPEKRFITLKVTRIIR